MDKEEDKKFCVYIHTSPSNKKYVGITSMNPKERWKNGRGYSHNKHFTNAIEKYGWNNFIHEIVAENLTEEEACKMESELIEKYNTFDSDNGYNATTGGEIGKQHTEEVRRKQSELAKKMWEDEEYRAKMHEVAISRIGENNPNYGNHKLAGENHPNWGKKLKPETIEKIRERASNISDETRKKMSDAAKARMTPEYIEHLRQQSTGRHPSEESRERMSESQKARWDEKSRAMWSEKFSGENNGMFGKHHSKETKQKISEKLSGENHPFYGKHFTEEEKKKAHEYSSLKTPVVQLTLQGEFVAEYDSCSYAGKAIGTDAGAISACCSNKGSSLHGFMWMKKEDYDPNNIKPYKNSAHKSVVQLSSNFEYIATYESLADAQRSTGCHSQNIGRCCKNYPKIKTKGFYWMYEDDYMKLNNINN